MLLYFGILVVCIIFWSALEVREDLKKSWKKYNENKAFDEQMKLFAVDGHWVDHKGVSHHNPELVKLNMTPERIALRKQIIQQKVDTYKQFYGY